MLTNQVHGAWFGLGADRVKRFWRRPCVHLFCEWKRLLPSLLSAHSMRLTFKRRRTNHLLPLLSIPVFTTCFSSSCKLVSLGTEGYERVSCVGLVAVLLWADRGKGTYLFAVVKSILVAVGQVEFVNLPSASLLSLRQFIQGSVELLLTRSLQEYHEKAVNTKITKKPAKQKVISIKLAKSWKYLLVI